MVTVITRFITLHLQLAIRHDEELTKMLSGVIITQGGVLASIQTIFLPKNTQKNKYTEDIAEYYSKTALFRPTNIFQK